MKLTTKILAVAFVVAIALTVTTVASAATFERNLTVGSSGADVTALQQALVAGGYLTMPAGANMGYFGALTKAAVIKYQIANAISGTGYVGPLTRAALNGAAPVTPGTGALCPNGNTLASNCQTAPGSTNTGALCPNGNTLASNCQTAPGTGSLSGGAGDVTVTLRSSGVESEVLEGANATKVLGFDVKAEGSDVNVTSAKIQLTHTGATGSTRLDRYMDEVTVYMDGKVVGTANASDFTKSGTVYTRSIALSNAVVKEGETARFQVAVSAVANIDSTDLSTDWDVELNQMRFTDASGAILTETPGANVIDQTFTFESISTSGDVKLTISENNQNVNSTHTVIVDDTADTNDVPVLSFNLDAKGSDITVDSLTFGVAATGAGVTEIANDFRLLKGNEEVGTVTIDKDCDGGSDGFASSSDTAICVTVSNLDEDGVTINEGDKQAFTLVADINDIEGGFTSGDSMSVTLNGDTTVSSDGAVTAEDKNGDALTNTELSGSADSTDVKFLSSGITVTTVTSSATVDPVQADVATDDLGIFTIVFDVTAVENTAFVELGSATRGTTESNTGANFVIQDAANSYAATTTGTIALADLTRVSGGSMSGEFVQINAGQTARFQLQVSFDPAQTTGTALGYRMYLYSVNFAATAADATDQQVLTPETDYRTPSRVVGN